MDLGKFLKVFDFVRSAVLPGTLALAGVPTDKIGSIVQLASNAEAALGPGTGSEKLRYVVNGLQDGMKASGASDQTIAEVSDAATAGINSAFSIAKDVQALHQSHVESILGASEPDKVSPASGTSPQGDGAGV